MKLPGIFPLFHKKRLFMEVERQAHGRTRKTRKILSIQDMKNDTVIVTVGKQLIKMRIM